MRLLIILTTMLLMVACDKSKPVNELLHRNADFSIHIVDKLPIGTDGSLAESHCTSDFKKCRIYILESTYPNCITHEVRHVMEGHWHPPDQANSVDCKVKN